MHLAETIHDDSTLSQLSETWCCKQIGKYRLNRPIKLKQDQSIDMMSMTKL